MTTTTKTIEQLQNESRRMRTFGTISGVATIVGAGLVGLASVPAAAVLGLAGAAVATGTLLKKLGDERTVAQRTGRLATTNDAPAVATH